MPPKSQNKPKNPSVKKANKSSSQNMDRGLDQAPLAQNRSSSQRRGFVPIRYKESERIATIAGSTTFLVDSDIPMNPGLASSFPWLSGHAVLYEKYKVHKLIYRYKNLKGAATNGNVIMSFDYDTLDTAPATAVEMTQSTKWIDGAPWRIFELVVPPDGRTLFTRRSGVGGADLKTYDMGRLYVATEGCADTSDLGYLEVEYDIELIGKQSGSTPTAGLNRSISMFTQTADQTFTTTASNLLFATAIANPLNVANAAGVFTPEVGSYLVSFYFNSSVAPGATSQLLVNGAATTPATLLDSTIAGPCAASMIVVCTGTTTISVSAITGSGTSTVAANRNRISFTRL
nr:MAG: hypothetical protein [Narnaviridae sp.]